MPTLLLADDSVTTQRVVALTFADESFRVVTVSDGQQAIDAMAGMRPDLVLAGTTLARTNGYELAEYMRGVAALADVPVLLLSGAFESVDAARLKASGARGVIEKPLEPTAVISRVKELLGLKDTRPAPAAGRLVTSAEMPPERKTAPRAAPAAPPAVRQPKVSSWDELRQETGLGPDAPSVQGEAPASGDDYLDSLDAAFDSLDRHLAGRHSAETQPQRRNPSPPLGQASGAADPRSPGRRPPATSDSASRQSVFEVDTDWFATDNRKSDDHAAQQDMVAGAHEAMPARPDAPSGSSVFEVDDEWFAQDDQAREALRQQQQQLAAEMGIHDVELPEAQPAINAAAPADGLDFDFGLGDIKPQGQAPPAPAAGSPSAPPASRPAPAAMAPAPPPAPVEPPAPPRPVTAAVSSLAPIAQLAPAAPVAPTAPVAPMAPPASFVPGSVADDFAALLAFETGDAFPPRVAPPAAALPAAVPAATPEITSAMLDEIAERVAERLSAGGFGADLRQSMTVAIRDTVRAVVADSSERLVRDEIARIKARIEREIQ